MLTINSLLLLVKHYHLTDEKNCFSKAISMAETELNEILNPSREYPPFVYYLILEHMYNNPKYQGNKFSMLNNDDKTNVFKETLESLSDISNS
jgi:hypothetical protein